MRHLAYLAICSAMLVMNALGAESALARINAALEKDWKNQKLTPVPSSSDEVFLRRAWLDIAGRIPPVNEIKNFLADRDPDKRRKLIDRLLLSDGYADMMAMRYADMLRVKSEFPINLWPNAVQLYFRYLRDSAARNLPYNVMARALLTASGSNFRVVCQRCISLTGQRIKRITTAQPCSTLFLCRLCPCFWPCFFLAHSPHQLRPFFCFSISSR